MSKPPSPKWHRYVRFWRANVAADVDDEIDFHIDARTDELLASGLSPVDARSQALSEFGDVSRTRLTLRAMDQRHESRHHYIEALADTWNDVRIAARSLGRSPGFVLVVSLTLALGIGVNTAVYSIVDAYLFRPMFVPNGRELVVLAQTDPALSAPHEMSYPNYRDYRSDTAIFRDLAAHVIQTVNLSGGGRRAERMWVEEVTANFFTLLGLHPALGRLFVPGDDAGELAHPYIVLAYDFWQSHFGGSPHVVGDTIRLNDRPVTIIGVAPRGFHGVDALLRVDGFTPLNQTWPSYGRQLDERGSQNFNVIGRLRPGLSLAAARQALQAKALQLEREYPADNRNVRVVLLPETQSRPNIAISGNVPTIAAAFMVLVFLVLTIACANVASLLLARAVTQQRERAIRAALGASQWQLVRRVLIECLLLAVLGGIGALILARLAMNALVGIRIAADVPVQWTIALDNRVIVFTVAVVVITAAIAAVAPALAIRRRDLHEPLKASGRGASHGHQRLRALLVVAQMAVSVVVLMCAALFASSTRNASRIDPGFRTDHVLMATATLDIQGYDSIRGKQLERDVLRSVTSLPGVQSAALARYTPFGYNNDIEFIFPEGSPVKIPENGFGYFNNIVSPSYFATMNIPIVAGRGFADADDERSPKVVIVTRQLARAMWPGQDAIGRRLRFGKNGPMLEVVGVTGDIQYFSLGEPSKPFVFRPYAQAYRPTFTLNIRTAVDPASVAGSVRAAIAQLDPSLPVFDVRTMDDHIKNGRAMLGTRLGAAFSTVFGALALVLATIGVYGLVSYAVTQRAREIGIRVALGARAPAVIRLVVRQGVRTAIVGVILGGIAALGVTQLLANLLYGVAPRDPVVLTAVVSALVTVAIVASLIPAGRATRLDPVASLRAE